MKEKDLIRFMDRMIEERKAEYALGTAHIYQKSKAWVIEAIWTVSQTAGKQLEHGVYLYAGAQGCL